MFPYDGQLVNDFRETKQRKEVAHQKVNNFILDPHVSDELGDISHCYATCANLTMDPFVLNVIKHGIKLDFCGEAICSNLTPLCSLSAEGIKAVNREIQTLLLQNVIAPVTLKRDSFVSSVFTTEKSDGSHWTILNLKKLNESISNLHFKMESLNNVRHLIKPGVWMGPLTSRMHITVFA